MKLLGGGEKLTGWGKNGPAYFFPGERMGRPILSPGKKLTGGKFRPVATDLRKSWRNTPGHVFFFKIQAYFMSLIQAYFFQSRPGKKSAQIIHTLTLRNRILFSGSAWKKYPPGLFLLRTFFNMEFLDFNRVDHD